MDIQFWASTDVGRVREHNEDNFLVDKRLRLFVVCDGMGGHAAGEVASAMCVKLVREMLSEQRELIEFVHQAPHDPVARKQLMGVLEQSLRDASAQIYEAALEDDAKRGMGTTCCVLLLTNEHGYIAHVGDSRIYLLRQHEIHQMTEDHSLYNEMVRMGKIRPGESVNLPNKNAVTRAVGVRDHVDVDVLDFELETGDRFLLCSDGLSGYFTSNEQITSMIGVSDIRTATEQCIDFAVEAGGKDNITAILVNITTTGAQAAASAALDESVLELLKQSPVFDYLSQKELGHLGSLILVRDLHDGERLSAPGEELSDLSLILDGEIAIHAPDHTHLKTLGEGEHLGDLGFVDAHPSPVHLVAQGAGRIATISRSQILDLLRHEPELSVKILWNLLQVFAGQLRGLPLELLVGVPMQAQVPELVPESTPAPMSAPMHIDVSSVVDHYAHPPASSISESTSWGEEGEDTSPPTLRPVIDVPEPVAKLTPAQEQELWGFEATRRGSLEEVTINPSTELSEPEEDLRATSEFSRNDIEQIAAHRAQAKADAARPKPSRSGPLPPVTPRKKVDLSPPRAPRPVPPLSKGITGEGQTTPAAAAAASPTRQAPAKPSPRSSKPSTKTSISGSSDPTDTPFGGRRPVTGASKKVSPAKKNPFDKAPPSAVVSRPPSSQDRSLPRDALAQTVQLDSEEFEQIKAAHKAALHKQKKPDE